MYACNQAESEQTKIKPAVKLKDEQNNMFYAKLVHYDANTNGYKK